MSNEAIWIAKLRDWYQTDLGGEVLAEEKRVLDELLVSRFGYFLLMINQLSTQVDLLAESRIKCKVRIDIDQRLEGVAQVRAQGDELPVVADSIDTVVLAHTLEFAADPHQVLREVDRVLIGDGCVIIVGYNPISLFGLWKQLLKRSGRPPWCGKFRRVGQLRDWLSLLCFEVVSEHYCFFKPPLGSRTWLQRLSGWARFCTTFLPRQGGVYVLVAKKRVIPITPIGQRWRRKRRLFPGSVAEPTTRGMKHG